MDDRFDIGAGEHGKTEGMERAKLHCDPEWWRIMMVCAKEVALRQPYLTTDHVEKYRREHYPNHTTHEPRAIGPVMRECAKLEYFVQTADWHESSQKQNHRRPMRIWSSLIYKGPPPRRKPRPKDPRQGDLFE